MAPVLIRTRDDWRAEPPKSVTLVDPQDRDAFVVHYSTGEELARDRSEVDDWLRSIQDYHQGKGWADIGYNFAVDRFGRIWEGRGWNTVGAHADGWNTRGIGVVFLGDDDPGRDVPPAARAAIRLLYEVAVARAGHGLRIMGHRDANPDTACPGGELARFVDSNLTLGLPPVTRAGRPVTRRDRPRHRRGGPRPVPGPTGTGAPAFPLAQTRYFGDQTKAGVRESDQLERWQRQMHRRGWRIAADGVYGPETEAVAKAFQKEKGLKVDGRIGPRTWAAAWTALITR